MRLKHLSDRMTSLPELMTLDCENCIIMTLGKFRGSRKEWFVGNPCEKKASENFKASMWHIHEKHIFPHKKQASRVSHTVATRHVGQNNKLPPFTSLHPRRATFFLCKLHVWTTVSSSSLPRLSFSPHADCIIWERLPLRSHIDVCITAVLPRDPIQILAAQN